MAEVTYYVALPFVAADDGIAVGEATECFSANAAVMRAEARFRKPGILGAVAFSRSGDPATGEFGDATVASSATCRPISAPYETSLGSGTRSPGARADPRPGARNSNAAAGRRRNRLSRAVLSRMRAKVGDLCQERDVLRVASTA